MTYLVKPHLAMSVMLSVSIIFVSCTSQVQHNVIEDQSPERVVVGYVTSWSERMPDPSLVTHLNYAFGHVTTDFDSVRVDNPERLCSIVALKEANPQVEANIFKSVSNVNLNTVIAYKKDGVRHHFLEEY